MSMFAANGVQIEKTEQRAIQLRVLQRFIDICDKHSLDYYVIDGTLLGTIRHNGYIPWDDDIDVAMFRKEYEKFISIYLREYQHDKIKLINHNINKIYHLNFAKLHDSQTIVVEKDVKEVYQGIYGIYIDIFPLDRLPEDKVKRIALLRNNYRFLKLITMKVVDRKIKHKNICNKVIYNLFHIFFGFIPIAILTKIEENRIKRLNDKNIKSKYIRELSCKDNADDFYFIESDFENYIIRKFEDIDVRVPEGYDHILKTLYGDYLKLPPIEERIDHGIEAYRKK